MDVYLKKEDLKDAYDEAERCAIDWQKPFTEYERIAGNKLSELLADNMPKVNDGSLAASLLETPMQVLPSMQTGKFTSTSNKLAWVGEIANIIWNKKIVPNANTQATFFDKEQMALYRALKYGAQPRYNFFVSSERYTGSDWSLPYIKNVKLEPGKFSVEDCDYVFLDIYYTKLQLQRMISDQKKEVKLAKKEGREPDTTWNIKSLEKLVDMAKTYKEQEAMTAPERDKSVSVSGIKTTACFNRGINAPFYMFSKYLPTGELLREWKNPDPTGDLPITMQYCYENLESPYGIGRVELAGPTQNVLDYMTQAHVLATQIGLQPPSKLKGSTENTNLNSIVYAPNAMWELGQAELETVQTATSVYTQFPANFGLYKSQLQQLQGRTDGSVSAESGNPQFSKTPAGIRQQVERTNSQDNYLRNKADTASAKMAEKMMNVHMAQMHGADILDIVEEDAERLQTAGFFDENPQTPEPNINEIEILYDDLRETFRFEYDARPESDQETKDRLLELLDIYASNPTLPGLLQEDGYKFGIGEVFKGIVTATGVLNDKVLTKIDKEQEAGQVDENGQPIQPQGQQQGQPGGQPQGDPLLDADLAAKEQKMQQSDEIHQVKMEKMMQPSGSNKEATTEPQNAPQEDPRQLQEELQLTMETYGVDEKTATILMQARRQGVSEDAIVDYLGIGEQGGLDG
jgi:hypothetical protein